MDTIICTNISDIWQKYNIFGEKSCLKNKIKSYVKLLCNLRYSLWITVKEKVWISSKQKVIHIDKIC